MMFTTHKLQTVALFAAAALMVLILVAATNFGRASTGSDRANSAWSLRLTQQAQQIQKEAARAERARDTWTARMNAQVQAIRDEAARVKRAQDAASDRLTGLAKQQEAGGMSDRANAAWTDRLNGLAEAYAASN